MPASDVLEQELLELLFLNADFDNIGDATGIQGAGAAGTFQLSLSTGTLTDASTLATTEATYTSYARVTAARSSAVWSVSSGTASNTAAAISFPQCTGGSNTITDYGMGSPIAADELWIYSQLTASLSVSSGITPTFAAGDVDVSLT